MSKPSPVMLPQGPLVCALCLHDRTAPPCVPLSSVRHPIAVGPVRRPPRIAVGRAALLRAPRVVR